MYFGVLVVDKEKKEIIRQRVVRARNKQDAILQTIGVATPNTYVSELGSEKKAAFEKFNRLVMVVELLTRKEE